jgi:Acetyltransferase (GNAT) domain
MAVYRIDPLDDPRWPQFLERHSEASIFHTPGWLEALYCTYGYEPVVYSTSQPDHDLFNGVLFCQVNSWLTGRRLVSLPFSDHCQPLVDSPEELVEILNALENLKKRDHWKYIEIRPMHSDHAIIETQTDFKGSQAMYSHKLDLSPELNKIFCGFHESCVQRKIRRAERESLTYEEGGSESLLAKFYHLLLITRRRHLLPPQPIVWFRNLIQCLGERLRIRVVSKYGQPIASIITLAYKNSYVYKYGCSDPEFNNLGGTSLLFWRTIQEAKAKGSHELDLGRSECSNSGLVTFKDRWGAARSTIIYYRLPAIGSDNAAEEWKMKIARRLFACMPNGILIAVGKLLYKHIA